jgi:hypothetical protein
VQKTDKHHFQLIREYFLSFNEETRRRILGYDIPFLFSVLTAIEVCFLNDGNIELLAKNVKNEELKEHLHLLKNEYFFEAANRHILGESNPQITQILESCNSTFINLIADLSDVISYEYDLQAAIILSERAELKHLFQEIDKQDEFELSDQEMVTAITKNERTKLKRYFTEIDKSDERNATIKLFTKYAIAACLVGILGLTIYLRYLNINTKKADTIALQEKPKNYISDFTLPNLTEYKNYKTGIAINQTGFGFSGNTIPNNLNIKIISYKKQLDTLKILSSYQKNNINTINIINKQLDSINYIINTYTYNKKLKSLIINLSDQRNLQNIISLNNNDFSILYINLNSKYYKILETKKPQKLILISDFDLIDELKRIELINNLN